MEDGRGVVKYGPIGKEISMFRESCDTVPTSFSGKLLYCRGNVLKAILSFSSETFSIQVQDTALYTRHYSGGKKDFVFT